MMLKNGNFPAPQKGAFDDIACKHLLLATSMAKKVIGKYCNNVDFLFPVRIKIIFSTLKYCD